MLWQNWSLLVYDSSCDGLLAKTTADAKEVVTYDAYDQVDHDLTKVFCFHRWKWIEYLYCLQYGAPQYGALPPFKGKFLCAREPFEAYLQI